MSKVKVEITTYYPEDVPGAAGVSLSIGGKEVRRYYAFGEIKAEAFVDGLKFAYMTNPLKVDIDWVDGVVVDHKTARKPDFF
jgi:hypothetical protein